MSTENNELHSLLTNQEKKVLLLQELIQEEHNKDKLVKRSFARFLFNGIGAIVGGVLGFGIDNLFGLFEDGPPPITFVGVLLGAYLTGKLFEMIHRQVNSEKDRNKLKILNQILEREQRIMEHQSKMLENASTHDINNLTDYLSKAFSGIDELNRKLEESKMPLDQFIDMYQSRQELEAPDKAFLEKLEKKKEKK